MNNGFIRLSDYVVIRASDISSMEEIFKDGGNYICKPGEGVFFGTDINVKGNSIIVRKRLDEILKMLEVCPFEFVIKTEVN